MSFAALKDNVVVKIVSDYPENISEYQLVVDISDLVDQPQVGWVLNVNKLVRPASTYYGDELKIYRCITELKNYVMTLPPLERNYVTDLNIKLHRKSTLTKGECGKEEFFVNCNGVTYSDLIVKEEHVFTRDGLGFAIKRVTTITWMKNDETPHPLTKTLTKFYSQAEQIDEGKTRRANLINALQMPIVGLISLAMTGTTTPTLPVLIEGRNFVFTYKLQFDSYMGESNKDILDCLSNPANPMYITSASWTWIDFMTPYGLTIRNYLINAMTI